MPTLKRLKRAVIPIRERRKKDRPPRYRMSPVSRLLLAEWESTGQTLQWLADESGLAYTTVWRWQQRYSRATAHTEKLLAKALGVKIVLEK